MGCLPPKPGDFNVGDRDRCFPVPPEIPSEPSVEARDAEEQKVEMGPPGSGLESRFLQFFPTRLEKNARKLSLIDVVPPGRGLPDFQAPRKRARKRAMRFFPLSPKRNGAVPTEKP